jgi:parallel beta-helix repeat protein
MTTAGAVTTLHSFVLNDGQQPVSGVIQAADGNYYGTVFRGGTNADGTTFKTTSTGTFTLLHTFIGTDGTEPMSGLVQGTGADTNFYGTTPGTNALTTLKQQQFQDGVAEWAAFANLHFVEFTGAPPPTPPDPSPSFITVQESPAGNEGGFSSSVGKAGGEQFIQCGLHSWNRGTVCHEVGHALGLFHEQQRTDRDTYVTINFGNIPAGLQPNFAIINNGQTFGTAYDFYSIMHYQRKTFAINPNIDTIIMNAGYTQYADVIGNVYDRTLSKIERAGMANPNFYGSPSPLPSAVVTNTKDSGPGSLRTAIYYAFDRSTDPSPTPTTTTFNIPTTDPGYNSTSGTFTIKPTSLLPALGNGTTIDGTSETSFTGDTNTAGPEIVLDGSNFALLSVDPFNLVSPGLILRAANCTIKGLTIQNFNQWGIRLYQGSDPNGSAATGNVIGGATSSARNVISGNAFYGIAIHDSTTTGNLVQGNYIGTNQAGTAAQPNAFAGVAIYLGAHGNTISGNVLSGNTYQGVFIGDAGSNSNLVQGNFIGTDPSGTTAVPNLVGVEITNGAQSNTIGGTSGIATRNVISGNTADGVQAHGSGTLNNLIEGNYIGLTSDGTTALPNQGEGVQLYAGANATTIGGIATGARNVIAGNSGDGVIINACNGVTVQGELYWHGSQWHRGEGEWRSRSLYLERFAKCDRWWNHCSCP